MRRAGAIAAVVALCVAAALALGARGGDDGATTYKIVFDNAFGLAEGGDFRVGGVKAGKTKTFDVSKKKGHTPKAVVTAQITQPGFDNFRSDASCEIKPQSLPTGLNATLYPYQKAGFDWLHFLHEYDFGGCLADDMGLGKAQPRDATTPGLRTKKQQFRLAAQQQGQRSLR